MQRLACAAFLILIACKHNHNPAGQSDSPPPSDAATLDSPGDSGAARRPNIIFLLTDDLNVEVYSHMTRLQALMNAQGATFQNHFLNISLCCPSRTATLRGQYAHNTKIFSNGPPNGGFETFFADGSEAQTLPVFMSAAGYKTVLMGKYLNGYPNTAPTDYIPPGWTEFYSPVAGDPYGDLNYTLNENGTEKKYTADYMPDVLTGKAVDFIQRMSTGNAPFFMYITPYVPHAPATPAARYANDFPGAQAPRTPSFNQADVSHMPAWVQALPLLGPNQIADIDALYRKRLQSMEAIEDMMQSIVDTLTATGQLDNTYIVFSSDNGFHQGQHRLQSGKNTEFDEDLFVPLSIRGPGVPAGVTINYPTMNVDYVATFLDIAGAPLPAGVDGRSWLPLWSANPPPVTSWRQEVFLEHADDLGGDDGPRAPPGTMEPPDQLFTPPPPAKGKGAESPPAFEGVRTARYTFTQADDGTMELFDHTVDPDEMNNIAASADGTVISQLQALVKGMHGCTGQACRTAEQTTPPN